MGFGKSSGTTTVQLTPEQRETIALQNAALRDVFMPAYTSTVGGAGSVYNMINPAAVQTAQTAMDVAGRSGLLQEQAGTGAYLGGMGNLAQLFSPEYKQQQISAALQPAREETREQMNQQTALFGGAGGLGSSRQALASRNLASLAEQRMGSVAAQTSAAIEGQRQRAAETLINAGQQALAAAQQSAASRIGFAQAPQDVYSKYASVVFGVPQASTTPNYAGTQSQSTSGKGAGIQMQWPR